MSKTFGIVTGVLLALALFAFIGNVLLHVFETSGDPSSTR